MGIGENWRTHQFPARIFLCWDFPVCVTSAEHTVPYPQASCLPNLPLRGYTTLPNIVLKRCWLFFHWWEKNDKERRQCHVFLWKHVNLLDLPNLLNLLGEVKESMKANASCAVIPSLGSCWECTLALLYKAAILGIKWGWSAHGSLESFLFSALGLSLFFSMQICVWGGEEVVGGGKYFPLGFWDSPE